MRNSSPTLAELQESVRRFRDERDWRQFHTLKDLAAAIAIEAGELQQELLWIHRSDEGDRLKLRRDEIASELADVVILALNFAEAAELDLGAAVQAKLAANEVRYPASEVRGSALRHSERRGK